MNRNDHPLWTGDVYSRSLWTGNSYSRSLRNHSQSLRIWKRGIITGSLWTESKWRTFLTIRDNLFLKFVCVDNRSALTLALCTLHFALKAPHIMCMSRREMDDEGLSWSSPKRKSDKYTKTKMKWWIFSSMTLTDTSNREELLALASALTGNGAVHEGVPTRLIPLILLMSQAYR